MLTFAAVVLALGLPAGPGQGQIVSLTLSPPSPVVRGASETFSIGFQTPCGAVQINFGDETTVVLSISGPSPLTTTHAYPATGSFTITVKGQADCGGQTSTTLIVTDPPPPPPPALPDLVIAVTTSGTRSVQPNSPTTLQVTVRNTGAGSASNVVFAVVFAELDWHAPPGGSVGQGCSFGLHDGHSAAVCNAGRIPAGSVYHLQINVVTPALPGGQAAVDVHVQALADPDRHLPETNDDNNTDSVVIHLAALPNLDPETHGPTHVTAGANYTYPVDVHNSGAGPAQAPVVRMQLPREVDFVRVEQSAFATCTTSGTAGAGGGVFLTCTGPSLAGGETAHVDVVVRPIVGLSDGQQMLFTVNVDPDRRVAETDEYDNSAGVMTTITSPADLRISSVTVTDLPEPPPASGGTSCTADIRPDVLANTLVRVTVANDGPGVSPSTRLHLTWERGMVRESAGESTNCPPGLSCHRGVCAGVAAPPCFTDCDVSSVFPGRSHTIDVRMHRPGGLFEGRVVLGQATVDPQSAVNDPDRSNNSRSMVREGLPEPVATAVVPGPGGLVAALLVFAGLGAVSGARRLRRGPRT